MRSAWAVVAKLAFVALALTLSGVPLVGAQEPDSPTWHATGFIPVDEQTYRSFEATPLYRDFLPVSVDLSARFPRPGDQGQMGSCVGWAVGYAARSYYAHAVEKRPKATPAHIASPAYIYHTIRKRSCDDGSMIFDALDLLKAGSLSLKDFPYSDTQCIRPTPAQHGRAGDFRIEKWQRVDFRKLDQLKAPLAKGDPVIFAFGPTTEDFHSLRGNEPYKGTGKPDEKNSGHAVTIVGYDEQKQAFKVINSWGIGWGANGFGWVSYGVVNRFGLEAYTMQVARREPIPPPVPTPRPVDPNLLSELGIGSLRCAELVPRSEGGKTVIEGFVGYPEDLQKVKDAIRGKAIELKVDLRAWPQCEALLTLADPLSQTERPQLRLLADQAQVAEGDTIAIEIETPSYPSYLYIGYIQADGSVANIHQPRGPVASPLPAYRKLRFGDGEDGRARYVVSAPYGEEMIIVLASKSPLFDEPLPSLQTEREYLTALRKALIALPEPGMPKRIAAASFITLKTMEK